MATFGKNILENLTTGMYYDSKVIYREYIQNACDQIDKAVEQGVLANIEEGSVDIHINAKDRQVTISDNATGIPAADFRRQLEDIANSDKKRGVDKGFRGIGRLCGLAYCKTLTFQATYLGETVRSIMIMDAKKMREMIASPTKYTVDEILDQITSFDEEVAPADEHGFIVQLDGINKENTDLLDKKKVTDYLSFVAPAPFSNKFWFRIKIYDHAEKIGYHIDEYRIFVEGNQLFKEYGTRLYKKSTSSGSKQIYDELCDVAFYDIYQNDTLVAWMWYGLCRFEKAIPKVDNPMYGFRVRQSNIQIGDNTIIAKFFKEDRGNSYFVGEIYAVSPELTPNSQRDNFNENETRVFFESQIKIYCYETLNKLYNMAAKLKSSYTKLTEYSSIVEEMSQKMHSGFVDDKEKDDLSRRVAEAEKSKDDAKKALAKIPSKETTGDDPVSVVQIAIKEHFTKKSTEQKLEKAEAKQAALTSSTADKTKWFTDSLSRLDKSKRKLVAQIVGIVSKHTDEETLNAIKADIEKVYR